jgi:Zn-dependent protease
MKMDGDEILQLLISVVAVALSLTLASGGSDTGSSDFIFYMCAFTLTVGLGFVLHEMAHKFVAMSYGARATFRAWTAGLFLMLALAIVVRMTGLPIMFLAPGAVYIYATRLTKEQSGIISIAGPLTNIALSAIFFISAVILLPISETATKIAVLGTSVNMFLAFFNMLPIFPLDGSKVFFWNRTIWLAVFGFTFIASSFMGFF